MLGENSVALLGAVETYLVREASNGPLTCFNHEGYECVYTMYIAI